MARPVLKKPADWARQPVPPIPLVDQTNADISAEDLEKLEG